MKCKTIIKLYSAATTAVISAAVTCTAVYAESVPDSGFTKKAEIPEGWLLWHSYSDYSALDSRLYLRSPGGLTETVSGDFIHAMNGSFGNSPDCFTFMAIDSKADEWDIFVCESGKITNLTENSGFRNEDPKFSPDGRSIVFKRGHWDNSIDDFWYDLALIDVKTKETVMLTNDAAEEAMPCFSADGRYIYYTGYTNRIGSIYRMDTASHNTETVYSESGITAYYPITYGNELYFTKWYSKENKCDQIMHYDGNEITPLVFDSDNYDCSDACPIDGSKMIFSSTMNVSYDLYYYDGSNVSALDSINTELNELGADFFPCEEKVIMGDVNSDGEFGIADLVKMENWLLAVPGSELENAEAANFNEDDIIDVFDLCLMRKELLK